MKMRIVIMQSYSRSHAQASCSQHDWIRKLTSSLARYVVDFELFNLAYTQLSAVLQDTGGFGGQATLPDEA
jgi:hypothetical protein